MCTKKFMGYTLSNVSDDPSYPLYGVFNPEKKQVYTLVFPSDFKDEVWRDMYASAPTTRDKRKVFKELMMSLGKAYRSGIDCVEKVWNRGMGSLSMFKLYPDHGLLLVNKALCNAWDKKHLEDALDILSDVHLDVKYVEYGYPAYAYKSFGLGLLESA